MTAQDMATTMPGRRAGQLGSVMGVLGGRGDWDFVEGQKPWQEGDGGKG